MRSSTRTAGLLLSILAGLEQGQSHAQILVDSSLTRRYVNESAAQVYKSGIAVEPGSGNIAIAFIRLIPGTNIINSRSLLSAISLDRGQSWTLHENLDLGITRDNNREVRNFHTIATPQSPVIVWEEREILPQADSLQDVPVITKDLGGWNAGNWRNFVVDTTGTLANVVQARYLMLSIAPDDPNLWGIAAYHRRQALPGEYVMFYRSTDAGVTWGDPIIVAHDISGYPDSTKVEDIYEAQGGYGTLGANGTGIFAFVGEFAPDDSLGNPIFSLSSDGGKTWSAPARIPGSEMYQARLIPSPGYLTTFLDPQGNWHVFLFAYNFFARDGVEILDWKLANGSWRLTKIPRPSNHYNEGVLFRFRSYSPLHVASDEKGAMYMAYTYLVDTTGVVLNPPENTQKLDVFVTKSEDGGESWGEPTNVTNTDTLAENYVSLAPVVNNYLHFTYTLEPTGNTEPWYLYYQAVPRERIPSTRVVERSTDDILPRKHVLLQSYPNPFQERTVITLNLQQPEQVRLSVFNVLGQEVAVLVNKLLFAGSHQVTWNGVGLPAGVYFLRLNVPSDTMTKKIVSIGSATR